MKTLADLKRAMQLGTLWECFHHASNKSRGVRMITLAQTNAVAFNTPSKRSWFDFPLAKDLKFKDDGSVEVYDLLYDSKEQKENYILKLTYKQIKEVE